MIFRLMRNVENTSCMGTQPPRRWMAGSKSKKDTSAEEDDGPIK